MPLHLGERHLGPGQTERHRQRTEQRAVSGQCSAGQLPLAFLGIEGAEAEVAVRLERAYPSLLGQGEGPTIGGCGSLALREIRPRANLTEEAQGIRLAPAFLVPTGAR